MIDHIKTIPIHNVIIITGDFNARIGQDSYFKDESKCISQYTYTDQTNENGICLRDLCLSNNLIHLPSKFPHKKSHQWTWQHPNKFKAQLDHILCCSKWKNSIKDCRAYTSTIESDHRPMTVIFKLSLRINKNSQRKVQYDWASLSNNNNKDLQKKYKNIIANKFALLEELGDLELRDIQEKYTSIMKVIEESNKVIIPQLG